MHELLMFNKRSTKVHLGQWKPTSEEAVQRKVTLHLNYYCCNIFVTVACWWQCSKNDTHIPFAVPQLSKVHVPKNKCAFLLASAQFAGNGWCLLWFLWFLRGMRRRLVKDALPWSSQETEMNLRKSTIGLPLLAQCSNKSCVRWANGKMMHK